MLGIPDVPGGASVQSRERALLGGDFNSTPLLLTIIADLEVSWKGCIPDKNYYS